MGSEGGVQLSQWSNIWRVQNRSFTGTGFGCMREKRKLNVRDISSTIEIIPQIPMVGVSKNMFCTMYTNCTTIQWLLYPGLLFYWARFEFMQEKERILGKEERKTDFRRKASIETCRKWKKWPIISLFIARVLLTFYLLYFFTYLIYKKEFYFISYQMNK